MLVGYARVSTIEQDADLQIKALQEVGCERIFRETASGAQRDRPQLKAMIEFARADDTVVVWKFDRLARSLKQLIETVEGLNENGIGFRSLTEQVDTNSPGGMLVFHIFGALAEFERSLIRERTIAGLHAARERGRVGGRPRSLSEKDLEVARSLLAAKQFTVAEVADRLGTSSATLYRYLPAAKSST